MRVGLKEKKKKKHREEVGVVGLVVHAEREREITGRDRVRHHSTSMELTDQPDLALMRDRGQQQKKKQREEVRIVGLVVHAERKRSLEGTGHGVTQCLWSSPIGPI